MNLNTNVFDLWVYRRDGATVRYLLMYTSQEKADRWFHGGRFWQIPGGFFNEGEEVIDALRRVLTELQLVATSLWAVEHTYIIYNRRRQNIEIIPVFAAEVNSAGEVPLTWEHSECGWFSAEQCAAKIHFRGLIEGLGWTREYITEKADPAAEFRLA